jgi:hypothetical protein
MGGRAGGVLLEENTSHVCTAATVRLVVRAALCQIGNIQQE